MNTQQYRLSMTKQTDNITCMYYKYIYNTHLSAFTKSGFLFNNKTKTQKTGCIKNYAEQLSGGIVD